jgi:hypothetical protein
MTTEWINARKQKPPEGDEGRSDDVLVLFDDGAFAVLFYDYDSIGWFDSYGSECSGYASPLYWMPLPDTPMPEAS